MARSLLLLFPLPPSQLSSPLLLLLLLSHRNAEPQPRRHQSLQQRLFLSLSLPLLHLLLPALLLCRGLVLFRNSPLQPLHSAAPPGPPLPPSAGSTARFPHPLLHPPHLAGLLSPLLLLVSSVLQSNLQLQQLQHQQQQLPVLQLLQPLQLQIEWPSSLLQPQPLAPCHPQALPSLQPAAPLRSPTQPSPPSPCAPRLLLSRSPDHSSHLQPLPNLRLPLTPPNPQPLLPNLQLPFLHSDRRLHTPTPIPMPIPMAHHRQPLRSAGHRW